MNQRVLMIPGPTNLSEDVLKALCQPMVGHTSKEFYEEFKETQLLTAKLFGSSEERTVILSGSGTFGMEAFFASFTNAGDKVLSLVNGYFGNRIVEIGNIYGLKIKTLDFGPGKDIDLDLVRKELEKEKYDVVTATHIDTSTGVINEIHELGNLVKQHNALFMVDMVSSLGCVNFKFEDEPVDYAFSASQKCVGAPPGVSMIAFSEELLNAKKDVKPRSYYFDLKKWMAVMKDPSTYLTTPNIPVIRALRIALHEVFEEGLEQKVKRHEELGKLAYNFVKSQGWQPLASRPSPSVIAFDIGRPVASRIVDEMYKKGILIAKGFGDLKERVLRVGYMGWTTVELLRNTLIKISEIYRSIS